MSKYEKEQGILKPADIKKIEPIDKTKKSHHKKKFPPHWEIRISGRKHYISPSKPLKSDDWDWQWTKNKQDTYFYYHTSNEYKEVVKLLDENNLDGALEIYLKHHPETKNWPVRFINLQPMNTVREII